MNSRVRRTTQLIKETNTQKLKISKLQKANKKLSEIVWFLISLMFATYIGCSVILLNNREMNLPKPNTTVIAWTGKNWYKAYMDENLEFRNAETGEKIGQVIKWKTSN